MTGGRYTDVFNATHTDFTSMIPQVWGPAGQVLSYRLDLRPGDAVLDVCCGTGTCALPAAAAVGPHGLVHAIDLADDLLEHGRLIAAERALQNVDFVCADATVWEPTSAVPAAGYDALCSSYGVFFLPDMDTDFGRLARLVRPGGRIGVTTWLGGVGDDFIGAYFEAVRRHLPDRRRSANPAYAAMGRVDTVDRLATWLSRFGKSVQVEVLSNLIPTTDTFAWNFVRGSGLRAALADAGPPVLAAVRDEFATVLTERGIHTFDATTLVGTANRPH